MNVIKGIELFGMNFESMYVDENQKVAFKSAIGLPKFSKFVLDLKERTITAYNGTEVLEIVFKQDIPKEIESQITLSTEAIISDISKYSKRLKSDIEPVWLFDVNDEDIPYMISTPTIFSNCLYSPKYKQGFLYYTNIHLKQKGIEGYASYEEAIISIAKKVKEKELVFQSKMDGANIYFETTLKELIDLTH